LLLNGEFGKDSFKILTRELPFKGDCAGLIERLKAEDFRFKFPKVLEVVWGKNLSLQNREVDLHLIKPTGVDRCMDQNCVRIPGLKTVDRGLAPVGGTVVSDPKDTTSRAYGC
jgi:hypothetical protein